MKYLWDSFPSVDWGLVATGSISFTWGAFQNLDSGGQFPELQQPGNLHLVLCAVTVRSDVYLFFNYEG